MKFIPLIFLIITMGCKHQTIQNNTNWSVKTADSFIAEFPCADSIHWVGQSNHFSWQAGYMMYTMEKLWRLTGDEKYFNYIKKYVDDQVDEEGNIPDFKPDALDNFLPGYSILLMYEVTKAEKYKKAAETIYSAFQSYPRNEDGGFWHGEWCKHQMWVDGIFMGQIFACRYAKTMGESAAFDLVTQQMSMGLGHCLKENGMLLHGYDETKSASWANPETGMASEVWSEGMGWFTNLLVDVFDYLPESNPQYEYLRSVLVKVSEGLAQVQDSSTGMWCQVVDKPYEPSNWNETSGTGMFIYFLKKSMDKGYINKDEFEPLVQKAYKGVIKKAVTGDDGFIDIIDCSSIGVQNDYQAYISQPKEVNTFAGISSFILGTSSMEF